MAELTGSAADAGQMNHMQHVIETAILPYRENTEAIVVVGALLRVARILLRAYKPDLRQGFQSACIAYLQGKTDLGDEATPSTLQRLGFWVPPGSKN